MCKVIFLPVSCAVETILNMIYTLLLMIECFVRQIFHIVFNIVTFILQVVAILPLCIIFLLTSELSGFFCSRFPNALIHVKNFAFFCTAVYLIYMNNPFDKMIHIQRIRRPSTNASSEWDYTNASFNNTRYITKDM